MFSTTHHRLTALSLVLLAGSSVVIGGCNGPTKAGLEARADARERLDKVNSHVTFDQAEQSFEVGQFERALREIDGAITRYPKEAEFFILRGRILHELNRLDVAMQSFDAAIELDEELAEPHYRAGIIQQRWSRHEKALEAYRTAFDLEDTHAPYLTATIEAMITLEQYPQALSMLEEHRSAFEHSVALRVLEGQIAMLTGDTKLAAQMMAEARLMSPDDPMLLEELALLQFEAGFFGECLQSVRERQASVAEERPDLQHLEARCLAELGQPEEARNIYIKLTYSKEDDPEMWSDLGFLAWEMGDYMRVQQCASRLVALVPGRYEGYLLKGVHARFKNNHGEAVRHFWDATQRAPELSMPYVMLGHTFEFLGQHEEAYLSYRSALKADPRNQQATMLLTRLGQNQSENQAITSVDPGSMFDQEP